MIPAQSTEVRANQVKWLRMLWSGGLRQGREQLSARRADGTYEFCCLGVGRKTVRSLLPDEVGEEPYMDWEDSIRLGLDEGDQGTCAEWNDTDHLTFREIAVLLAGRFDIRAEEYQT